MHFRILRDRSNRDGDALIVRIGWDCGVCAEENDPDDRFCWQCSAERGDWLCGCGRLNRKTDRECSDCGREKSEP